MKKLLVAGLVMLGSLVVVGTGLADSVTLSYEEGTLVPAREITNFSPSGASPATPALNRSSFQFRHNRHLLASFSLANG